MAVTRATLSYHGPANRRESVHPEKGQHELPHYKFSSFPRVSLSRDAGETVEVDVRGEVASSDKNGMIIESHPLGSTSISQLLEQLVT